MFNDIQTDEWKENQLSKPNCFEYYFKYAFKGKINQQYTFGIIKPDAKQQDVIVKSLFKTAIPKNQVPPKIISDQEPKISFKRLDKNIAYLSIQTCIINDTTKEMICLFIDSLNNEGIKNLVVDLRYNLGGEEMSVFTNIFNKKPINDTTFGMVKSNAKYSFLKYTIEYLDIDTLFADFQSIPGKDGFWKKYYNELSTYKNNKPYEGTIYVLTGSGEQSSGAEMAFDLYKSGAIIIGEETGGDYYQMNAIHFTDVKLGSTNLLLTLPLMKIIDNTKIDPRIPKNRGLIPHYTIKRTIKSLINDEDNQLEYCIQLIKGQNK